MLRLTAKLRSSRKSTKSIPGALLLIVLSLLGCNSCSTNNNSIVDATPPANYSIIIDNGALASKSTTVTLYLSATDETTSFSQMQISNNPDFSNSLWEPFASQRSWTIPSVEGNKTVYVKFRDVSGNETDVVSAEIILDTTVPSSPSISIQEGAFTTNNLIHLNLSASGADFLMVSNNPDFSDSLWEPLASQRPWTIPSGEGNKTVYVKFRDVAGNETDVVSAAIILDTTVPSSPSISIQEGAYTTNNHIHMNLSAAGASLVKISEDQNFTDISPISYAAGATWNLSSGDGKKTLYIKYSDDAGNETTTLLATIILDTISPTTPVIFNKAQLTEQANIEITLSTGSVDTNFSNYQLKGGQYTDWTDTSETSAFGFTLTQWGQHILSIRGKDFAGNVSIPADVEMESQFKPGFTGSLDAMTSYRYQDHMIVGLDGSLLIFIQRGSEGSAGQKGLIAVRSIDDGKTWTFFAQIGASDSDTNSSASAVALSNGDIGVVISNNNTDASASNDVTYRLLTWLTGSQTWTVGSAVMVYNASEITGAGSAVIEVDSDGDLWIAARYFSNGAYSIRVFYSTDSGQQWVNSGQTFGTIDSAVQRKPLLRAFNGNKLGLVVQDSVKMKWYYRNDSDSKTGVWSAEVEIDDSEKPSTNNGSHFQMMQDNNNDLHLVWQKGHSSGPNETYYRKFSGGSWGDRVTLFTFENGNYPDIAMGKDGIIYVFVNETSIVNDAGKIYITVFDGISWSSPKLMTNILGAKRLITVHKYSSLINKNYVPVAYQYSIKPPFDLGFGRVMLGKDIYN